MKLKSIVAVSIAFSTYAEAGAPHMCWVERVTKQGEEVRVLMLERYRGAARMITLRDGKRTEVTKNEDNSFTLREGESANLSTLAHDVCTVKATSLNGVLGVSLSARFCMPNPDIGCQSSNEFVAAE